MNKNQITFKPLEESNIKLLAQWFKQPHVAQWLWPLVAVLNLLSIIIICMLSHDVGVAISRLGNLTVWSFSLFLATIVFAAASVASIIALWRTPQGEIRSMIHIYATMITIAIVTSTAYLAYWGIIGLRTWA